MSDKVQKALEERKRKKRQEELKKVSPTYKESIEKVNAALETRKSRIKSNASTAASNIQERYNSEVKAYNDYISNNKIINSGKWGKDINIGGVLEEQRERQLSISKLKRDLEVYRSYLDESVVDEALANLNGISEGYQGILTAADTLSKYKTEEEYNDAIKVSELYNMPSKEIAPYLVTEEDKKKKKEYDALKKKRDDLCGELYVKYIRKDGYTAEEALKKASEDSRIVEYDKQLSAYGDVDTSGIAYTTLDGTNITWQSLYDQKKQEEEFNALLAELSAKDDWEEQSQYITTNKKGTARANAPLDRDTDWEYEDVNQQSLNVTGGGFSRDPGYATVTTDKEKAVFNYLYHTRGKEAAMKWHKSREEIYRNRVESKGIENAVKFAKEYPVFSDLVAVAGSVMSGGEYVADIIRGDIGDTNQMSAVSSAIKGTRMEQIDWEVGNWDAFDFLYGTGTSIAESALSMVAFGKFGGVALGLSAAAQGTNDALNRGMSKNQAFWNGLMSGVFEGVFESLQIGAFTDLTKHLKNIDVKNIAKYIGKNMWNNAKEETLTEIANIAYDTIINGDFSQAETAIRQYMNQGLSEKDAKRKVALELGGQIAEAAGSGALMGIGFSAGGSAVSAYRNVQAGKALNARGANAVNALVDLGKSYSPNSAVYQLAEKVQQKPSNLNVGGLVRSAMDVSGNTFENIADELVKRGFNSDEARKFAEQMIKQAEGGKMSKKYADAIVGDSDLRDVYETFISGRLVPSNKYGGTIKHLTTPQITQNEQQVTELIEGKPHDSMKSTVLNEYRANKNGFGVDQFPAILAEHLEEQIASSPAKKNSVQSTYELAAVGKTANLKTGDAVTVKKIDSISTSGDMKLTLDDGTVVKASDLAYGSDAEAIFIENIGNIKLGKKSIGTTSANALYQAAMSALKNNPDMTADEAMSLIKGLEEAYVYGAYNFGEAELLATNEDGTAKRLSGELTETQRKFAYELGTQDRVEEYKIVREVCEALGLEAVFENLDKWVTDENGRRVLFSPDGYFDKNTGKVHINTSTAVKHNPLAFVIKHELTHFGETNKDAYKKFVRAVKNSKEFETWLRKQTGSKTRTVDQMIADLAEDECETREKYGIKQGPAENTQEVYANFVGDMLFEKNGKTLDSLINELDAKQRPAFIQFIVDFLHWLQQKISGNNDFSFELQRLESKYVAMLKSAQKAAENKTTTSEGGVRHSLNIKHTNGTEETLADARSLTGDQAISYLNQAKRGELQGHTYIPVRKDTPQVIIDALKNAGINIRNLSLIMQVRKARQAMSTKNNGGKSKHGRNVRSHALTPEEIVEIVSNLNHPNTVILQTNRYDQNGEVLPDNVAVFVEYGSASSEGLAVIEFESSINPEFIDSKFGDTNYHTVVTIFEPDIERNGIPFDYVEELLQNPDNFELEIGKRQPERSATREKHPNTSNELPSKISIPNLDESVKEKNGFGTKVNESVAQNEINRLYSIAKSRDVNLIAKAEESESQNKSRESIFKETGLVRDPKGVWVCELDDSKMKFYPKGDARKKNDPNYKELLKYEKIIASYPEFDYDDNGNIILTKEQAKVFGRYHYLVDTLEQKYGYVDTLKDYVVHDELYKQYPQIGDAVFQICDFEDPDALGSYNAESNTIYLSERFYRGDLAKANAEDTLIHEIQHILQTLDGRQNGSNKSYWQAKLNRDGHLPYNDSLERELTPFEAYYFTAGEIEAREVVKRIEYEEGERKEVLPSLFWEYAVFPDDNNDSKKNEDVKYSVLTPNRASSEYLKAIEDGDMESVQRMVDEAAEKAMPDSKVRNSDGALMVTYHGTEADDFYTFDKARQGQTDSSVFGRGYYFTNDYEYSSDFGDNVRRFYLNITNPFVISRVDAPASEIAKKLKAHKVKIDFDYTGMVAYEFARKFGNQRFSDTLQALGYDGVIVDEGFECVVFDRNQMKSADPVTYDDDGDVIPLSERFDEEKVDVRYSISNPRRVDGYTEKQYNNFGWITDNGLVSTAERETLFSRYADYKHNRDIYPTTRFGEAVIHSTECPDVIMYIKGRIDCPNVTKVVRIKDDVAHIKEVLLRYEREGYSQPFRIVENYFGEWILDINYKRDYESFREVKARKERERSQAGDSNSGIKQNGAGSARKDKTANRAELTDSDFASSDNKQYSIADSTDYTAEMDALDELFRNGEIDRDEYRERINELYEQAGKAHGTIPKGETVTGEENFDDPVPRSVDGKKKVRQYVRTVIEGGELTEDMLTVTKQQILSGDLSYELTSEEKNMQYAERALKAGTAEAIWQKIAQGEEAPNAGGIAIGETLLKLAVERKDTVEFVKLVAELSEVGTRMGQSIQALSLLKRMTGIGQLYYVRKSVDMLNADLEKKLGKNAPDITIDETLARQLAESETAEDFDITYGAIINHIASQVPATFLDKWNAWRYMAMLVNPTTHIRNFYGNGIFCPAVKLKDTIAATLEQTMIKDSANRTKSVIINKEYKSFARDDFENIKDVITSGGKMNPKRSIADNKPIFKTKVLEAVRKFNFDMLEAEDAIFLKAHYIRALGGYLQARKIDVRNVQPNVLAKAREYAILEAQKATYRDASALANVISSLSSKSTVANVLVEGVLPFKKTPINIIKRGVEYSPFGLLKTIFKGSYDLKKGNITASQWIDGLASGLTGTAITALGMALASIGIVKGGFDDDEEDRFNKMLGMQEYSIEIFGYSYTIDWAAPACMPFFMGVSAMESIQEEGNLNTFSSIANAFGAGLEPFINLSMLSGIQDTISAARYSDADDIVQSVAMNIVSSYFSQALPSIGGKLTNVVDPVRRSNYIDKTSPLPEWVQSALNTIGSKIPFLSQNKPEYINAWGEGEDKGGVVRRFFQSFLSPGYLSDVEVTEIDAEIKRLAESTGDQSVFPDAANKYIKFKGVTKHLSADEYVEYATNKGQMSAEYIREFINHPEYNSLTDEQKVETIGKLYGLADAKAKAAVSYTFDEVSAMSDGVISSEKYESYNAEQQQSIVDNYFLGGQYKSLVRLESSGGSAVEYYINSSAEPTSSSGYSASDVNMAFDLGDTELAFEMIGDIVKDKTENYINKGEKKTDAEKKAKSSVKSSMTSYWKPLYLEANKNKNYDEMRRIREILYASGLYDNKNAVVQATQNWIKSSKK